MRFALSFLALALAPVASPPLAWAETSVAVDDKKAAEALALVDKLQMERVLDNMFRDLKGVFAENAIASMLREDKGGIQQLFDSLPGGRDRFAEILGDEFLSSLRKQYPNFKAEAAQQYAQVFSQQELQQLNMFFSSGVGEKWLSSSPNVEKAMGLWGQKAGMKAGLEALTATMKRIEAGDIEKDKSQ